MIVTKTLFDRSKEFESGDEFARFVRDAGKWLTRRSKRVFKRDDTFYSRVLVSRGSSEFAGKRTVVKVCFEVVFLLNEEVHLARDELERNACSSDEVH